MNLKSINRQPFMTEIIIVIQVLVFILMTLAGGSTNTAVLVEFGARVTSLIQAGEIWRLFTPMFLHIGLMHLVINSITVYYIGIQIENIFGHARFLVIYLLSGIAGNLASFVFLPNTLSAGASTSIFGLFGAFLMLGESFRNNPYIRLMSRQFLMFVVINLAFDLFSPGIDIYGHIGGLVGGFLLGYAVGAPRLGKVERVKQLLSVVIIVAGFIALYMMGMK